MARCNRCRGTGKVLKTSQVSVAVQDRDRSSVGASVVKAHVICHVCRGTGKVRIIVGRS